MNATTTKELIAIAGYIRTNYHGSLKKNGSSNCNTFIENGILLMISEYCKPLLLAYISNARGISKYTNSLKDSILTANKGLSFNDQHIANLKKSANHVMQNYKCVVVGATLQCS